MIRKHCMPFGKVLVPTEAKYAYNTVHTLVKDGVYIYFVYIQIRHFTSIVLICEQDESR